MAVTILLGCYEHSIFGYELGFNPEYIKKEDNDNQESDEEPLLLKQIFSYASHLGAVKSVAAAGRVLVTGSSDEVINVYDLRRRKEVGQLHNHGGSITVVAFAGSTQQQLEPNTHATHMISGSWDGMMCLWKVADWTCLHTIRGHTGAVLALAMHPSSRLALSVGQDQRLKIWNLLTGKLSQSLLLEHEAELVIFNPSGDLFAVLFPEVKKIVVYNLDGTVLRTLEFPHKITYSVFLTDSTIAGASDEGSIGIWDTCKGFLYAINLSGVTRIKSMATLPSINKLLIEDNQVTSPHVVLACSDGLVVVLNLENGAILATTQTEARLTCIAVTVVSHEQHTKTTETATGVVPKTEASTIPTIKEKGKGKRKVTEVETSQTNFGDDELAKLKKIRTTATPTKTKASTPTKAKASTPTKASTATKTKATAATQHDKKIKVNVESTKNKKKSK